MNAAAFALLVALVAAPQPVRLEVSPRLGIAPRDMRIRVWIERDANNRWLEVRASSEQFERSTGFSLEGEHAAGVFEWYWKSLPCGRYVVRARVTQVDGRRRDATDRAHYVC